MICIITMVCAAVSAWLAKGKAKAEGRARKAERAYGGDFLLALSALLAGVAMADGAVTADEVAAVERMFDLMAMTEAERAMCVGNFMMAQRKGFAMRELAKSIAERTNPVVCAFLYRLLRHVAQADGRFDEREKRVLAEIEKALGLGDGAADAPLSAQDRKTLEDAGVPPSLMKFAA